MIEKALIEKVDAFEVWLEIDGKSYYLRTFSSRAKAEDRLKDSLGKIVPVKALKITSKTNQGIQYIVSNRFLWLE